MGQDTEINPSANSIHSACGSLRIRKAGGAQGSSDASMYRTMYAHVM